MFLLIDKPQGITSHDVIDKVRKITGIRKVGHAGTLDPNATGLLVVGVGRGSTKKLGEISKSTRKTYLAQIRLGEERDTDDVEGAVVSRARGVLPPSLREIEKLLQNLVGEYKQVPPQYSAVKVGGKRAYEFAREGKNVVLNSRKIIIYRCDLIRYQYPIVEIELEVSAGTYVRSIARDIGRELGVGAYLRQLRRTRIGDFSVEDAVELDKLNRKNWKDFTEEI